MSPENANHFSHINIIRSFFFFSSRRRHTRSFGDWSSDVCSSDLGREMMVAALRDPAAASAMAALLLITGHVGRANNGLIALYPHNNSTGAIDFGLLPDYGLGRVKIADDQRGLSASEMTSGKMRALYVMACDPASDEGFVKPDFLVVHDLFLTETAKLADVI